MNTKIEGLQGTPVRSAAPAAAPSKVGGSKGAEVGAVAAGDSVQLSEDAADISALAKQLGGASAIDAGKVAQVRAALESGSYQINAREIAQRLAQLERALGVGLL